MATQSEQAMAATVVAYLQEQGWDVYQEVELRHGRADIVATMGRLVWVVECKTTLTLQVMGQADRWPAHFRSVAVPMPSRGRGEAADMIRKIAVWRQFGILEIGPNGVSTLVPAALCRHNDKDAQKIRSKLRPEHQTMAPAGSAAGGYWTPYGGTMGAVRTFLDRRGSAGATLGEVMAAVPHHYRSDKIARTTMPMRLERTETRWCVVCGEGKDRRYYRRGSEPKPG